MSEDDVCQSCGLPVAQCQENRQMVMDFLHSDDEEIGFPEVQFTGCFMCGQAFSEETGAVEVVFDDGDKDWVCYRCVSAMPREAFASYEDAERVEARDMSLLRGVDRGRPVEDVPTDERL